MIKVALVRGKYLNNFEGQNYIFKNKINLTAFSTRKPIHNKFPFKTVQLESFSDLNLGRLGKIIGNRTLGDLQNLKGIEKFASEFDIFHTADSHYYYSYQLAKLRAKGKVKRLISTSWEIIPFNNEGTLRKKFIKGFVKRYTDLFICYTDKAKECLILEGISTEKIKVVKLGVDLKRFKPAKRKNKKVNILFVGRDVPEKGLKDLKEALNVIDKSMYRLNVLNKSNYNNLPKIYQKNDIFVMPSKTTKTWEEQYGMVLVEAMASGLPIIAYNSGAIAENLGKAGILIEEGNIGKLSSNIRKLIKDPILRQKLGKLSRKRAEGYFNSKDTARELTKIYETISRSSD